MFSRIRLLLWPLLLLAALLLPAAFTPSVQAASIPVPTSWPGSPVRVPILMYHYIRANPRPRDLLGADLSVSPVHFAQQMKYLVADGYHTVTLDDLMSAMEYGTPLPNKPLVLTFDDGYQDLYTAAYPVLTELGLRATSFVITGRVGRPGYLTWPEMRAMQASGLVKFEAHTVSHLGLAHVPLARAQFELTASKLTLEAELGRRVDYFCYPSGDYSPLVEALVAGDGYKAAFTTHNGVWHEMGERLAMSRMRIHGGSTLAAFAAGLGDRKVPAARQVSRRRVVSNKHFEIR